MRASIAISMSVVGGSFSEERVKSAAAVQGKLSEVLVDMTVAAGWLISRGR